MCSVCRSAILEVEPIKNAKRKKGVSRSWLSKTNAELSMQTMWSQYILGSR